MLRRGLVAAMLVAAASIATAQEVRVNAAFDRRRVFLGDMVSYTITLSAETLPGRVVPQPDFSGFDVLSGPATGQSSEIRFVNGSMTKRENLTFNWRLRPQKEGVAAVPQLSVVMGGQKVAVPRAEVQVDPQGAPGSGADDQQAAADERAQQYRARAEGRQPWGQPVRRAGEGLSVRTEISDSTPWAGEAIVVRDVLTFDTNVSSFGEREPIEFPGFAKKKNEKVKPEGRRIQDPTTGEIRSEATLAQWVVVPLTPGKKQLPSHSYKFFLPSTDPMERMFGGREYEVARAAPASVVDVRPLPEGAPATFGGGVGSFQLDAKLAATTLKAGDGTQLVITIRGRGAFDGVSVPQIDLPAAIKTFEPEITEHSDFTADGQIEGSKSFTIPLLVTEQGVHEIPPISWAFFDPQTGRYVERRTGPLRIEAAGGEVPIVATVPIQPISDVQVQGTDIRHVRSELPEWHADIAATGLPRWMWLAVAIGPLLNLAVAAAALVARLGRRDPQLRRAQEAGGVARKRLGRAEAALAAGRPVDAANDAAKAVSGFVSDRLGLGAELAPAEASAAVLAQGEPELAKRVERFLSDCDFARFASGGAADSKRLIDEARALLPEVARLEPRPSVA